LETLRGTFLLHQKFYLTKSTSSPYFSASIPFVASQVALRTNEPFIVAYEVTADIDIPKIIKHIENATIATINDNTTSTLR
jgi:hypothetical protein